MELKVKDVQTLMNHALEPPLVKNMRWELNPDDQKNTQIVIVAAPPKSGSTWAMNVLGRAMNARMRRLTYAWSSNEHELYPPALLLARGQKSVSQMHMKATPHNVGLILDFNIIPLVLTRNIYDAIVSFARDLQKKARTPTNAPGTLGYSFVWVPYCDSGWSLERFIDHAIQYYTPWYLTFLLSWNEYASITSAVRIRYERLFADPYEQFLKIGEQIDLPLTLDRENMTRNVIQNPAISGTKSPPGDALNHLTNSQIDRIRDYFKPDMGDWVESHLSHEI